MNINTSPSVLSDVTLEIIGGIKVVVPDSLELITPYVLREQLDWFEDEIKFVRTLLLPGDVVLDIGANYGLYALSMAKIVGGSGHVYAFEPASSTASYLQRSIEQNSFNQVSLIRAALSNKSGTAKLGLNDNSELNSLETSISSDGNTESVALTTLDIQVAELSWHNVAFVKLDAEGEEENILMGGNQFFKIFSPLVMFELKHLNTINIQLIQKFKDMSYQIYRLIPGLNILAPFSLDEPMDAYQLNLFGCKDDCAVRLEKEGKLVRDITLTSASIGGSGNWEDSILQYPYAKYLRSKWQVVQQNTPIASSSIFLKILSSYSSIYATASASVRYNKLKQTHVDLLELCDHAPTLSRLITLSRIASEFGERGIALNALTQALSFVLKGEASLDEPFLATSVRFESLDPQNRITNWLVASLSEQMEKLQFYSSYYSRQNNFQRLLAIRNTGFQSEEMDRRIQLIKSRFGMPA